MGHGGAHTVEACVKCLEYCVAPSKHKVTSGQRHHYFISRSVSTVNRSTLRLPASRWAACALSLCLR